MTNSENAMPRLGLRLRHPRAIAQVYLSIPIQIVAQRFGYLRRVLHCSDAAINHEPLEHPVHLMAQVQLHLRRLRWALPSPEASLSSFVTGFKSATTRRTILSVMPLK